MSSAVDRKGRVIVENGVDEVLGQLDSAIDELLEKRKKDVDVIAIAVGVPALTARMI